MRNLVFVLLFSFIVDRKDSSAQKIEPYFGAIIVENIDSSVAWYRNVLDLKIIKQQENSEAGYKIVNLGNDKMLLELLELRSSISVKTIIETNPGKKWINGIMKIGFKVDNIDSMYNDFKKMKLMFRGDIVTDPLTGKKMFILLDPDENYIQFFEK